jgi:1-acyl-sn-glycerol-3-phosphate acyltransferase
MLKAIRPLRSVSNLHDMGFLRTILAYTWLVFGTLVLGSLCVFFLALRPNGGAWWAVARFWARGLTKAAGMTEVMTRGTEILSQVPNPVVMVNHISGLDPPTMLMISERPLRFVAKHTLFYFPFFGWCMHAMGMVPVNRTSRDKAIEQMNRAAELVRGGRPVLVFPEGTRSDDGQLLPFKKGGFVMAIRAEVPIVPVGIAGSREIFPGGFFCAAKQPIAVVVGEPIETEPYGVDDKEALMALVRQRIEALQKEARQLLVSKLSSAEAAVT